MTTYSEADTKEKLSKEQLELMAKSQHDYLIDFIESTTRFDTHRIRLLLDMGVDSARKQLEGL